MIRYWRRKGFAIDRPITSNASKGLEERSNVYRGQAKEELVAAPNVAGIAKGTESSCK
jgi:hypothetical protein